METNRSNDDLVKEGVQKAIEILTKVYEGEDAFCSRCGSKLFGRRTRRSLYIYCPECGFIGHALLAEPRKPKKTYRARKADKC